MHLRQPQPFWSLRPRRWSIAAAALILSAASPACAAENRDAASFQPTQALQAYLRIDTTNPPGLESAGAHFLASLFHARGIPTQTLVDHSGRTSLYAKINAKEQPAPTVVLLHHIDVVPAGDGWTHDPFSGDLDDGKVWGRGAIDAKSLGIAHLDALFETLDSGGPISRNIVFLAVADEEAGGQHGAAFVLDQYPELFEDVDLVLNEAGLNKTVNGRMLWWGIEFAQKRPLWLQLTATGRGGHGSGFNPQSATHTLTRGLANLLDVAGSDLRVSTAAHLYFQSLAELHGEKFRRLFGGRSPEEVENRLRELETQNRLYDVLLPGMQTAFLDTVQVTRVDNGSNSVNVVPAQASALVDIRLLPHTDADAFLESVREALGPQVDVDILLQSPPVPEPSLDAPGYRSLTDALRREPRGGSLPIVPTLIPGTTDSRYFRARNIEAYGFSPFAIAGLDSRGIHGPDEYIRVSDFERGLEVMRHVLLHLTSATPQGQ